MIKNVPRHIPRGYRPKVLSVFQDQLWDGRRLYTDSRLDNKLYNTLRKDHD